MSTEDKTPQEKFDADFEEWAGTNFIPEDARLALKAIAHRWYFFGRAHATTANAKMLEHFAQELRGTVMGADNAQYDLIGNTIPSEGRVS